MATMNAETDAWLKSNDSKDYFELLKMPTVGAEPLHLRDCVQAATWLKKWLGTIGAEAELLLPSGGGADVSASVPVVFGELKGGEGATTVLVYGHYDVQPPDPLEALDFSQASVSSFIVAICHFPLSVPGDVPCVSAPRPPQGPSRRGRRRGPCRAR